LFSFTGEFALSLSVEEEFPVDLTPLPQKEVCFGLKKCVSHVMESPLEQISNVFDISHVQNWSGWWQLIFVRYIIYFVTIQGWRMTQTASHNWVFKKILSLAS
jgi:hypothetical protein